MGIVAHNGRPLSGQTDGGGGEGHVDVLHGTVQILSMRAVRQGFATGVSAQLYTGIRIHLLCFVEIVAVSF